jgi:dsRNA-specific ribonuclease
VRLEIFGDCVLSTTISQMAYEKFEDQLTPDLLEQIHNCLCSNYRLCRFAKMLKLQDLIYARKSFLSEKELVNVFMSLLAAIIMDSGREVAINFIRDLIGPTMDRLVKNGNFVGIQINDTNEKIPIKNVVDDQHEYFFI